MSQCNRILAGAALLVVFSSSLLTAEEVRREFGSHQRAHPAGGTLLGVPEPYMAAGYHADENRICGSRLLLADGTEKEINGAAKTTQNQRFGMLSTDEGFVMVGLHGGTNELLEQPLPKGPAYRYYFSYGDEPWGQFGGMHACRSGDGLVGIHIGQNVFTAVTTRTPPTMEDEPKSPARIDVYLDLLACDEPHAGNGDQIRLYANGEPLLEDDGDALIFDAPGAAKGRSVNPFVTQKGKALGKLLKLGAIKVDAEGPRNVVLSIVDGRADAKTLQALAGIKQLASQATSGEEKDSQFSKAVAKLNREAKSTQFVGTCICTIDVDKLEGALTVHWLSGDTDDHTVVVSALERQARFHCSRDNGQYWAALHVEVK